MPLPITTSFNDLPEKMRREFDKKASKVDAGSREGQPKVGSYIVNGRKAMWAFQRYANGVIFCKQYKARPTPDDAGIPGIPRVPAWPRLPDGLLSPMEIKTASQYMPKSDALYNAWNEEEIESPTSPGIPMASGISTNGSNPEIEFTNGLAVRNVTADAESVDGWFFISKAIGYLSYWREHRSELGAPRGPALVNGSGFLFGSSERADRRRSTGQKFERGLITFHPNYGFNLVVGDFALAYGEHGGYVFLGAARTLPISVTINADGNTIVEIEAQYFEHGQLVRLPGGRIRAMVNSGAVLLPATHPNFPFMRVSTELDKIIVHEESGDNSNIFGNVHDEIRMSIIHTHGQGDTFVFTPTQIAMETDDGQTYSLHTRIYQGTLLAASTVTILGLEEEDPDLAIATLQSFENQVRESAGGIDALNEIVDKLRIVNANLDIDDVLWTIAGGGVIGGAIGVIATAEIVVITVGAGVAGAAVGSTVTFSTSSSAGPIGVAIGLVVAALVGGIALAVSEGDRPEPLMFSSFGLSGFDLVDALIGDSLPAPISLPPVVVDGEYHIRVSRVFQRDEDAILERLRYSVNEDDEFFADYELVLRHSVS